MANIQNLQEKVAKAQENVEKRKATIARHEKQLVKKIKIVNDALGINLTGKTKDEIGILREPYRATDDSWLFYDVIGKLEDIKGATKKLAEVEAILENWEAKLRKELDKEDFINNNIPQVIKDFLEQWKVMAYEWHIVKYDSYLEYAKALDEEVKEAEAELGIDSYRRPTREQEKQLKEMGLDWKSVQKKKSSFAGATVTYMLTIRNKEERLKWLDNTLEQEKKAKMIDLINRINAVAGEIKDARNLRVSQKGNLDGIIKGTKADAKVETIGAGGYNIQCFHYRTLVHKIN